MLSTYRWGADALRQVSYVLAGMLIYLVSSNAQAQNLTNLFQSTEFIVGIIVVPAIFALVLIAVLLFDPSSRMLVFKVVSGWLMGVILCVFAIDSSFGWYALVALIFSVWIGVVALAVALFVEWKRSA